MVAAMLSSGCSGPGGRRRRTMRHRPDTAQPRKERPMATPRSLAHPAAPDLAGTTALVTGAGRGIGRRLAQRLAALGASVGLVARSGDELEETRDRIEAAGGTAAATRADVTDADA